MKAFQRKYSATKIHAIHEARFAKNLSYRQIVNLAKTGELVAGEPFDIGIEYVGELCRAENKRRAGKVESALADKPHRDAIEILRRRLISTADSMVRYYEEQAKKKPQDFDAAKFRQVIACAREAASLPAPKEDKPPAPGQSQDGRRRDEQTRTGPAGALLAAMRGHNTSSPEPSTTDEPNAPTKQDHDPSSGSGSLARAA
jgi:hypothetical protein